VPLFPPFQRLGGGAPLSKGEGSAPVMHPRSGVPGHTLPRGRGAFAFLPQAVITMPQFRKKCVKLDGNRTEQLYSVQPL